VAGILYETLGYSKTLWVVRSIYLPAVVHRAVCTGCAPRDANPSSPYEPKR
jgi:hypothetical protein